MKTNRRRKLLYLVIVSFFILGCGTGQLFGPTVTPTPTITFTPTQTLTPTPTSTPTPLPTVVGIWLGFYSWDCDEGTAYSMEIYNDGTVSSLGDKESNSGTWQVEGNTFTRDYHDAEAVYTGTINDDFTVITGTMRAGSQKGCWSAVKIR